MKAIFLWLATLPGPWQVFIPIIFLVAVVLISIYGKLGISWGFGKIGIGGKKNNGRSCMECSKYHRAESAKADRRIYRLESQSMKNKMNYLGQKLLDMKLELYDGFEDVIKDQEVEDVAQQLQDFKTRTELILDYKVKNEVRRSIKENGFHLKEDDKLNKYISDQIAVITDLVTDAYLKYYEKDMIDTVIKKCKPRISAAVRETYKYAKETELNTTEKIEEIETEYERNLDQFVGINS